LTKRDGQESNSMLSWGRRARRSLKRKKGGASSRNVGNLRRKTRRQDEKKSTASAFREGIKR